MAILKFHPFHPGEWYCDICDQFIKFAGTNEVLAKRDFDHYLKYRDDYSVDLNVPYSDIEIAKKNGAKWDPIKKTWFIDAEILLDKNKQSRLNNLLGYIDIKSFNRFYDEKFVHYEKYLYPSKKYKHVVSIKYENIKNKLYPNDNAKYHKDIMWELLDW